MMLQVARIDISKCKNLLAFISKSNLFTLRNGKIYAEIQQRRKLVWKYMKKENNLMNFKPGGGKIFV